MSSTGVPSMASRSLDVQVETIDFQQSAAGDAEPVARRPVSLEHVFDYRVTSGRSPSATRGGLVHHRRRPGSGAAPVRAHAGAHGRHVDGRAERMPGTARGRRGEGARPYTAMPAKATPVTPSL